MSQDPRDQILSQKVSTEFRSRVLDEAHELIAENKDSRREFFFTAIRNIGLASAAFWLGAKVIPDNDLEEEFVLEALEENADLFLEVEPDDFEILLASEEIAELDEVL